MSNIMLITFLCCVLFVPDKTQGSTTRNRDTFSSQVLAISTTLMTSANDYIYDFADLPEFNNAIGSSICNSTYSCIGDSILPRNCFCDEICRHLGDCCWDKRQDESLISQPLPPKEVFSCLQIPEINYGYPLLIVNKCLLNWDDSQIKEMCEAPKLDNLLERIPVTDIHTNLHFRNIYCALCNYVMEYLFWKPELMCQEDFYLDNASGGPSTNDCAFQFLPPGQNVSKRVCLQYPIIDKCRETSNFVNMSMVSMCTNGEYAVVYGNMEAYKNIHCALCNGVDENSLQCNAIKRPTTSTVSVKGTRKLYSYRLLVDLNIAAGDKDGVLIEYRSKCSTTGKIYDPFKNLCIDVYCYKPFVFESGKCIFKPDSDGIKSNSTFTFKNQTCPYVLLESGTFEFISGKNIKLLSTGHIYNEMEYHIDGNQTFVCADIFTRGTEYLPMFSYEEVTITLACGILSLSALLINFLVYSCFPQLRNIPGKMLMSLIAALFVANLLFLVSASLEMIREVCIVVAIAMQYFFLASFCWMNIMNLDLWWTFSRQFTVINNDGKSSKRFCLYSAYAWMVPLVIITAAVSVNFADIDAQFRHWQPNYGSDVCWIRNREAMILFFMGPMILFKLFDIIAFCATVVHIYRARKQTAMVQKKKNKCTFLIYIKLSFIMGLTWVLAFISNIAQIPELWYAFIVLNTLQGLFICLCFVCTLKVFRLLSTRAITLLEKRRKGSNELTSCTASKSQSEKTMPTSVSKSSL